MLALSELSISFPLPDGRVSPVVRTVSLKVSKGAFCSIVGESGSGKTMTSLALLGLVNPSARIVGAFQLDGKWYDAAKISSIAPLRGRDVGIIFQDPVASLNPVRSIGSQLVETLRMHFPGLKGRAAMTKAAEALERVGIANAQTRLKQYPHQLSGGLNQRVMIAMALASNPKLLIADEPTTALDASIKRQIFDLLASLVDENGLTVLLISHDLNLVWDYSDFVYIMQHGEVVEAGTPDELIARPLLHPHAEELLTLGGLR